jgi:hypothetical protein
LENLNDEHFGDTNIYISHVETFKLLIEKLGGTIKPNNNFTQKFNDSLLDASKKELPIFIAVLAFIEYYYQSISTVFAIYIKNNFANANIHYNEHEELDNKHCNDLFSLLFNYNDDIIEKSLKYGEEIAYNIFNDYYNSFIFTKQSV